MCITARKQNLQVETESQLLLDTLQFTLVRKYLLRPAREEIAWCQICRRMAREILDAHLPPLDQPGTILDFGLLCPAPDAFLAVGYSWIKDTWDFWFHFSLCFMEVELGGVNEYFSFLGLEFQLSKSAARGCECLEQEEVRCRVRRITKSHHLSPNFNAHYLQVYTWGELQLTKSHHSSSLLYRCSPQPVYIKNSTISHHLLYPAIHIMTSKMHYISQNRTPS